MKKILELLTAKLNKWIDRLEELSYDYQDKIDEYYRRHINAKIR